MRRVFLTISSILVLLHAPVEATLFKGCGMLEFLDVEGGCFIFLADDGRHFDPANFSPFQSGDRVCVIGVIDYECITFCQVGPCLDIETIHPGDDCNGNGVDNATEIASGTAQDCNGNGIPDECEMDSDSDGSIDVCDLCPLDPFDDSDGDGLCGDVDNCPTVPSLDQTDSDVDGAGDICDCLPFDPGVMQAATEVEGLALELVVGSVLEQLPQLSWTSLDALAGSDTVYDIVSGDLEALHTMGSSTASCIANDVLDMPYLDARVGAPAIWYRVRAQNICGTGTYSDPTLDQNSPCP